MPTVEARALGRKRPLVPAWSVDAPALETSDGPLRLRDLIASVVRSEVASFQERAESRAFLRTLSAEEVEAGRERGKIEMGGRDQNATVDTDAAVAAALEAFEDGLYLVLIDESEVKELDAPIELGSETRIVFLRLAFLAGA